MLDAMFLYTGFIMTDIKNALYVQQEGGWSTVLDSSLLGRITKSMPHGCYFNTADFI